jgi:hypothetical protein
MGRLRIAPSIVPFDEPAGTAYVDRGDPAAYDFDITDFPEGGWFEMDLSAIVPDGAVAVYILVAISLAVPVGIDELAFREKSYPDDFPLTFYTRYAAAAGIVQFAQYLVRCSPDRKIEYKRGMVNPASIDMVVRGWMI